MKKWNQLLITGLLCMSLLTGCAQKIVQNVSVIEKGALKDVETEETQNLTPDEQRAVYLEELKEQVEAGELIYNLKDYSMDECKELVNQFYYDNPQFFWLTGGFEYSSLNGNVMLKLDSLYDDIDGRKAQLEEAAAPILEQASALGNDYDKAIYVHDTLCNMITYEHSTDESDQNIYSALVDHSCVCSGYARAYKYLMDRLGIETFIISGEGQGETHAWNGVYLDGELYFVDVTWDDVDGDNPVNCYGLFGMNTEQMNQIYTVNYPQNVPETSAEACNYYKRNGWYLWNCNEDELIAILASQNGNYPLRLQCANEDVYYWVLDLLGQQRFYELLNYVDMWPSTLNYFYRDSANEIVIQWS